MINLREKLAFGVDVSDYNTVNWELASQRIDFVWAKSSEGGSLAMKKFRSHVEGAKSVGMAVGAYHFARPDLNKTLSGARKEAQFFFEKVQSVADLGALELPAVLDYEPKPASVSDIDSAAWIMAFANHYKGLSGAFPILYASKGQLQSYGLQKFAYPAGLWVAQGLVNTPAAAVTTDPGIQWGFQSPRDGVIGKTFPNMETIAWQYSWEGRIPGLMIGNKQQTDVNVMTLAQLNQYRSNWANVLAVAAAGGVLGYLVYLYRNRV